MTARFERSSLPHHWRVLDHADHHAGLAWSDHGRWFARCLICGAHIAHPNGVRTRRGAAELLLVHRAGRHGDTNAEGTD